MPLAMDLRLEKNADVQRGLSAFARKAGVTVDFVAADQMRLWLQDLVSNKVEVPRSGPQGRKRVKADIERILIPFSAQEKSWIRDFGADDGVLGGKHRFKSKTGAVWLVDADMYEPGPSQATIRKWHDKQRLKSGRVTEAGTWDRRIGRWRSIRKLHVPKKDAQRYIKAQQSHVGKAKAGWLTALSAMAHAARTRARVPPWVLKAPHTPGALQMMRGGHGVVEATNRVPYAEDKFESWLPATLAKRHKDITGKMWLRMERVINQFNKAA